MKLQNNFTSVEQSRQLLELGLPKDSADCYISSSGEPCTVNNVMGSMLRFNSPCWSVGRLIEIIRECATDFDVCQILIETLVMPATDNVDVLIRLMTADEFKSDLDYSKLKN